MFTLTINTNGHNSICIILFMKKDIKYAIAEAIANVVRSHPLPDSAQSDCVCNLKNTISGVLNVLTKIFTVVVSIILTAIIK